MVDKLPQECVDKYCWLVSQRFIVAFMMFTSCLVAYLMRINLSVALLQMAAPKNVSIGKDSCAVSDHVEEENKDTTPEEFEFGWTDKDQGILLSSFFAGYFVTNLPGGIYSDTHGGKLTLGLSMILCIVCTFLTPPLTKAAGYEALFVLRVLIGMGEGTMFPAMTSLMSHWIPKRERASLGALSYSGVQIGCVLGNAVTGVLLKEYGWPSAFYVYGVVSLIWYILFEILVYPSPDTHRFITTKEKEYLDAELVPPRHGKIPWLEIFKSAPVWALILCQLGHHWALFSLVTLLPKYFNMMLRLSARDSGLYACLPFLIMWFTALTSGILSDWLVKHNYLELLNARKFFTVFGQFGAAIFLLVGVYSECNIVMVILFFVAALGMMGTFYCSARVNCMDISPNFSGIIMALMNGIGSIGGIISPSIFGYITIEGTFSEWKIFFWINFVVMTSTCVVYLVNASVEIQPWN